MNMRSARGSRLALAYGAMVFGLLAATYPSFGAMNPIIYHTPPQATDRAGHPVSAVITITPSLHGVIIQVTNTTPHMISSEQCISSVSLTLKPADGVSLGVSQGQARIVYPAGIYTADRPDDTHWKLAHHKTRYHLVSPGRTYNVIADTPGRKYDEADDSLIHAPGRNPFLANSPTFELVIPSLSFDPTNFSPSTTGADATPETPPAGRRVQTCDSTTAGANRPPGTSPPGPLSAPNLQIEDIVVGWGSAEPGGTDITDITISEDTAVAMAQDISFLFGDSPTGDGALGTADGTASLDGTALTSGGTVTQGGYWGGSGGIGGAGAAISSYSSGGGAFGGGGGFSLPGAINALNNGTNNNTGGNGGTTPVPEPSSLLLLNLAGLALLWPKRRRRTSAAAP